MRSKSYKEKI